MTLLPIEVMLVGIITDVSPVRYLKTPSPKKKTI